jgi:hypothetical protein
MRSYNSIGNIQCVPLGICPRGLSAMAKPHCSAVNAMRATHPCVAMMNKKYNNLLANFATSVAQGLKAKPHSRPAYMTLPQSTSGRRSVTAMTRSVLSKQGEGTVLAGATMMMTVTASPPSPPTSPTNPIQRSLNQSESQSMTVSRTCANGFDATLLLLKFQGDPNPPKLCTFR